MSRIAYVGRQIADFFTGGETYNAFHDIGFNLHKSNRRTRDAEDKMEYWLEIRAPHTITRIAQCAFTAQLLTSLSLQICNRDNHSYMPLILCTLFAKGMLLYNARHSLNRFESLEETIDRLHKKYSQEE